MPEPTLFGIGKAEWELYNSFANWIAAIGTVAAVWVSLHLANRVSRFKAKFSVGHRLVIQPGVPDTPEYVVFRIVNTGERSLRITQIGWKVGLFRKRYAMQLYDEIQSSRLPVDLAYGQEAQWLVPLAAREEPWLQYFAKGMLLPHLTTSLLTLRAHAMTSVGHIFEARPEQDLIDQLREAGRALQKKEG
jgi:hypothetical protein